MLAALSAVCPLPTAWPAYPACPEHAAADTVITGIRIAGHDNTLQSIHLSDRHICAITDGVTDPGDAFHFDARGLTAVPGLIDSHVHLFPPDSKSGITDDASLAAFVRDRLPGRLQTYLEHGVTSIISVGDPWPAVAELRTEIQAGRIAGPRLFLTGPILTAPDGYPAVTICARSDWCRTRLTVELRDAAHAKQTVSRLAEAGVDAIKVVFDGSRGRKLDISLLTVITREAHAIGLPVIGHVTSVSDALVAANLGVDVLAHLPSGGAVDDNSAAELARLNTTVISTAAVYAPLTRPDGRRTTVFGLPYGRGFAALQAQGLVNAKTLLAQDVALAFGTGTAMFTPDQSLSAERTALQRVPLDNESLLNAMTIRGARVIGKMRELGSIAAGKRADIVLMKPTEVNALPEPDNIVAVFVDGQLAVDRRKPEALAHQNPANK